MSRTLIRSAAGIAICVCYLGDAHRRLKLPTAWPDAEPVKTWHSLATLEYKKGTVTAVCSCGLWRRRADTEANARFQWRVHEQTLVARAADAARPLLDKALNRYRDAPRAPLTFGAAAGFTYDDFCRAVPALAEARRLVAWDRVAEVQLYRFIGYPLYLDTAYWRQIAAQTKEQAEGRCQAAVGTDRCGVTHGLEAHHPDRDYRFFGCELPEQLEALCAQHHRLFHPEKGEAGG